MRAVCEQLQAGAEAAEVEHLADQFLSADQQVIQVTYTDDEDLAPVGDTIRRADGRAVSARVDIQRYSTHELVALEAGVIATAQRRQRERAGAVPEQVVTAVLDSHVGRGGGQSGRPTRMAPDQEAMVRALTTSGHGVQLVNAHAGTARPSRWTPPEPSGRRPATGSSGRRWPPRRPRSSPTAPAWRAAPSAGCCWTWRTHERQGSAPTPC